LERPWRDERHLQIGPSEAEPFWSTFLRDLVRRGLKGVKLVISDAHEGLKAAITRVVGATWQRCRVGLLNNLFHAVVRWVMWPGVSRLAMRRIVCASAIRQANSATASRFRFIAAAVR
jgi:transposase-like protein